MRVSYHVLPASLGTVADVVQCGDLIRPAHQMSGTWLLSHHQGRSGLSEVRVWAGFGADLSR